mmetsp:Transcript_344/g.448  ORF Transcript_344/g.448 Transcript_344/m.448 type:complete len:89 (+) Transcript_344:3-269(+)
MHQIRAHLALEGHPLLGDETYGGMPIALCRRPCLHAQRLLIDVGNGPFDAWCPLPLDMASVLAVSTPLNQNSNALIKMWSNSRVTEVD